MPISAQDVLRVVQTRGPIIPNSIKQALGETDATMINVYLSELKAENKITFTHLQLGTSQFSYTPEQKPQLENLIEHLGEKDRRTANLLREKKILQASTQDPLVRVSLQEIKDFAKPIKVTTNQGEDIFYRYYLTSLEEAQTLIKQLLGGEKEEVPEPEPVEVPQPIEKAPEPPQPIEASGEKQTSLQEQPQPESAFAQQIETYCQENDIEITEITEVRKDAEIELILEVPTAVGTITFFAKAKNKKSSNDGDLASAILRAKTYNLPALYLTTGTVTKKALEQPELQDITVIEIGR